MGNIQVASCTRQSSLQGISSSDSELMIAYHSNNMPEGLDVSET